MSKTKTALLPLLPLALLALGCSGGGGSSPRSKPVDQPNPSTRASGKVTLDLVNDSAAKDLRAVTLRLAGVDIREKGKDWVALPLTAPELDLIHATGQAARPLVEAAPVPAGVYTAFRIRFAPDQNHITLRAGGQVHDLSVPGTLVDEDVHLKVADGATAQVAYLFNTAYAVQEKPAGSGAYTLRAPIWSGSPSRAEPRDPSPRGTLNRPGGGRFVVHSSLRTFAVTVRPGETAEVPKAQAAGMATEAQEPDTDA